MPLPPVYLLGMNAGALFALLVLAATILLVVFFVTRSNKRKKRALELAASVMANAVVEKQRVTGRVHGRQVTFALGMRGGGRNQSAWTEIYVWLPPLDAVVNLRRQTAYQEKLVRQGLAVDSRARRSRVRRGLHRRSRSGGHRA